jgi:hypothetical protein
MHGISGLQSSVLAVMLGADTGGGVLGGAFGWLVGIGAIYNTGGTPSCPLRCAPCLF